MELKAETESSGKYVGVSRKWIRCFTRTLTKRVQSPFLPIIMFNMDWVRPKLLVKNSF